MLIPKTSIYTFYLKTDDGSRLYIDDDRIIDRDGINGMDFENSGEVALEKGIHKYRVEYFQNWGGLGFEHSVESFEVTKQEVPSKWFRIKP